MSDAGISARDFGSAFKGFLEEAVSGAPAPEPFFLDRLRAHFGVDPGTLPVVAEQLATHEHANLQVALDAWLGEPGRTAELLGVNSEQKRGMGLTLADLVRPARAGLYGGGPPLPGPVDYVNLAAGDDTMLSCVQYGLYLVVDGGDALALLVRGPDLRSYQGNSVSVEVMAGDRERAARLLGELRGAMRGHNLYRGRIVSLSQEGPMRQTQVRFHRLPATAREDIVLPDGVLNRIERHAVGVARHAERLRAAGRHLKRGLLLYGPPGTGKTLTAMYLAGRMPERTVILLTGQSLGLVEQSCTMARLLQPATVILEDVDLVASERTTQTTACNAVLFDLLNQMDGLGDDADVLFVLTTNRPDLLEPALATRPGRVDQAVEVPLPDAACRARLIELYGRGLTLELTEPERLVERTQGVSAAFVKELVRKAALFAADEPGTDGIVVGDGHMEEALHDLVVDGGELTRSLLGARGVTPGPA